MIKKSAPDKQSLHVLPVAKGGWAIKRAGEPEPIQTFATKGEASAYARTLANKAGSGSVQVKAKKTAKKVAPKTAGPVVIHDKWIIASKPARQGKVSKIVPTAGKKGSPQFGSASGKFVIGPDFGDTPEDFHEYVERTCYWIHTPSSGLSEAAARCQATHGPRSKIQATRLS